MSNALTAARVIDPLVAGAGAADPEAVLRTVFGYPTFRGFQREVIDRIVDGGDALVLMPTGGGKSLCYQIPALLRPGVAIVVSPLIALMQDQVAAMDELGVRAAFLNSTLDGRAVAAVERRLREGALDLLYLAPERLLLERTLSLLEAVPLALFAIDEAHCVSQWGHDFRPEYGKLEILRERFAAVPRIALTATADTPTRREIAERLLVEPRIFVASFDRPNIRYRIIEKIEPRQQLLDFIRGEHPGAAGIVYCLSRNGVEETAAFLQTHGVAAEAYHAGLDGRARAERQRRFIDEDGRVMVATIAFGMGIDKPDVRFVAHLDMPRSVEGYFQETGRAGRDGAPADAWMTYGLADVVQQRRLIEMSEATDDYKRLSGAKLDAMLGLCESAACRRQRLLGYFDEVAEACGNCDNCLTPPVLWDATEAARKLLSCIYRCEQAGGFGFAATHIIDVLRGKETEKVAKFGHARLSTFGIGADLSEAQWRVLLRQLISAHAVEVDHARFNVLRLTALSRPLLRGEASLQLRAFERSVRAGKRGSKAAKTAGRDADGGAVLDPIAQAAFERLRSWRAETARARSVPAYVIFHDRTLQSIAVAAPRSLAALGAISGVGAAKLAHYGPALIDLVAGRVPAADAVDADPADADR